MNGLLSLLAAAGLAPDQPQDEQPTGDATVSPFVLEAARKPQPNAPPPPTPAAQYDNSTAVQGVNQAALGQAIQRPKSTLRDVLGTIGDAFLMSGGGDAMYRPALDRSRIAQAAVGFQDNPGTAASRIAGTGASGSMEIAQKMFDQATNSDIKKQNATSIDEYRKGQIEDKRTARMLKAREYAGGLLGKAKNADDYSLRYEQAKKILKSVDPSLEDWELDLTDPLDWKPGASDGYGMTAAQVAGDDRAGQRIDQAGQLGNDRIAATIRGQDVSAGTSRANTAARVGATMRGQDMISGDKAKALGAKDGGKTKPKGGGGIPPVNPQIVAGLRSGKFTDQQFDEYVGHPGAAKAYRGK